MSAMTVICSRCYLTRYSSEGYPAGWVLTKKGDCLCTDCATFWRRWALSCCGLSGVVPAFLMTLAVAEKISFQFWIGMGILAIVGILFSPVCLHFRRRANEKQ